MWAEYGASTRVLVNYGKYINENRSFSAASFHGLGASVGLPPSALKLIYFLLKNIFNNLLKIAILD